MRACHLPLIALPFVGACADSLVQLPTTPPPSRMTQTGEYDGSVPIYESADDIPNPEIFEISPLVYWSGRSAIASSRMEYFGNRAEEHLKITLMGPTPPTPTTGIGSSSHFWPWYNSHVTPGFSAVAPDDCGYDAKLDSQHYATVTGWINLFGFERETVTRTGDHFASQGQCAEKEEEVSKPTGGGDDCADCLDQPQLATWCVVRYRYNVNTGQILYYQILYCY